MALTLNFSKDASAARLDLSLLCAKARRYNRCPIAGTTHVESRGKFMIFQGSALSVELLPSGVAKLQFDLSESSVNKFNRHTLEELRNAVDLLAKSDAKGLVFTSLRADLSWELTSQNSPAFLLAAKKVLWPGWWRPMKSSTQ